MSPSELAQTVGILGESTLRGIVLTPLFLPLVIVACHRNGVFIFLAHEHVH